MVEIPSTKNVSRPPSKGMKGRGTSLRRSCDHPGLTESQNSQGPGVNCFLQSLGMPWGQGRAGGRPLDPSRAWPATFEALTSPLQLRAGRAVFDHHTSLEQLATQLICFLPVTGLAGGLAGFDQLEYVGSPGFSGRSLPEQT